MVTLAKKILRKLPPPLKKFLYIVFIILKKTVGKILRNTRAIVTSIKMKLNNLKLRVEKFFNIEYILSDLRNIINTEGLEGAIIFLKTKYNYFKPAAVRFLIALYSYSLEKSLLSIEYKDQNNFIIHFCCWGRNYANKAKKYLLPSLLASGNLPALSKKFNVIIFIHCDEDTKNTIKSSDVAKYIQEYAILQIETLPRKMIQNYKAAVDYPNYLFFKKVNCRNDLLKYLLLGALQTIALNESLQKQSFISFLMPDVILSDSFLSIALDKIKDKKLVVSSTFRTNYFTVHEEFKPFYIETESTILSIPANEMVRMQIEHLHQHEKRRIISEKTNCFMPTPRFIFKTKKGLILRAVQYHPVLMDCSKVHNKINSDYFPIDDFVLKHVLTDEIPYEKQVWLCSDASFMNIMELSGDEPEKLELPYLEELFYDYDQLVDLLGCMLKGSSETLNDQMSRFFMQNQIKFLSNKNYHHDDEIIDNDAFVQDVYKKIGFEIL